jgi:hypothetical protein
VTLFQTKFCDNSKLMFKLHLTFTSLAYCQSLAFKSGNFNIQALVRDASLALYGSLCLSDDVIHFPHMALIELN